MFKHYGRFFTLCRANRKLALICALTVSTFVANVIWFCFYHVDVYQEITTIFNSIGLAALVTLAIEGGPEVWAKHDKHYERSRFLRLFGQACETGNVTLLFANRKLKDAFQRSDIWETHYQYKPSSNDATMPSPEGITQWLPFQDFRGANYVASEVARVTSKTAQYRTDLSIDALEFDDFNNTIVSFGLGFNKFTHTLEQFTEKKLFCVDWSPSVRETDPQDKLTDNFIIDEKIDTAGFRKLIEEKPYRDFAIVARIVMKRPFDKPSRYFFICAGRTASGTAAAGYFLATKWQYILGLYKDNKELDKDSVAIVVEYWYGHTDDKPEASKDFDCTCAVLEVNGNPIINWWREFM